MQIQGDVAALHAFNFDSVKLDGCGGETDLVLFNKYMQAAGKPILVENCHWGKVVRAGWLWHEHHVVKRISASCVASVLRARPPCC